MASNPRESVEDLEEKIFQELIRRIDNLEKMEANGVWHSKRFREERRTMVCECIVRFGREKKNS